MDVEGDSSMYRFTGMLSELGGFSGKLGRYYALLDVILVFMASYALVIFTGVHQICAEMAGADIITFSEVGMEIAAPAVCAILLAVAAMAPISILLAMFTRRRRDGVCASVGAECLHAEGAMASAHLLGQHIPNWMSP